MRIAFLCVLRVVVVIHCLSQIAWQPVAQAAEPLAPMLRLPATDEDPAKIDFDRLPRVAGKRALVSAGDATWQFRLHNYLAHHDGKFWCMWSHGPVVEDNP